MEENQQSAESNQEAAQQPANLVDEAKKVAQIMRAEREKFEALIKRQELIKANEVLSGTAEAGMPKPPEETHEQRIKREANEFLKRAGYNPLT